MCSALCFNRNFIQLENDKICHLAKIDVSLLQMRNVINRRAQKFEIVGI